MTYRLLRQFEKTFVEGPYRHRNSTLGDAIAVEFYEDLLAIGRSSAFVRRVKEGLSVLNVQNTRQGIKARRGDGSFGEIVPNSQAVLVAGYEILRGPIATIEIGVEVKILSKAMIKQIDRVTGDLVGQVSQFRSRGGSPITVGIVGINQAPYAISWEGDREWRTDGRKHKHPINEAAEAERRLIQLAAPHFDEFVIIRFVATNDPTPDYKYSLQDTKRTLLDYGAALARTSSLYQARNA